MIDSIPRAEFETWVETATPPLADKSGVGIAALMTIAAFVDPIRQVDIFDAIAAAVAGGAHVGQRAEIIANALPWLGAGRARMALPRPLWEAFWNIAGSTPAPQTDELGLTQAVVAMGFHYDAPLLDRCEAALLEFKGVRDLIAQPEVRLKTSDLQGYAADSLATELLAMLTAQGYDLEVIDADTIVLPGDYPAHNRTNRRILQLHDIWHLVGGYGFTGAGEVAISGFQMAQFGQNYSTRFLATIMTKAALQAPPLAELLLTVMFEGWRHGRKTPELIAVAWHKRMSDPISQIRADLGIRPIDSDAIRAMEGMAQLAA